MSSERAARHTDTLLIPFLNAAQGSESENVLAQLLSAQARPIIKGIIKEKLRLFAGEADLHGQDAEDVYSDVVAQILGRLPDPKRFYGFQGPYLLWRRRDIQSPA